MSVLTPPELEKTTNLAGATPIVSDVSSWKDGGKGIGIGTDSSEWFMHKNGASVFCIGLTSYPLPE